MLLLKRSSHFARDFLRSRKNVDGVRNFSKKLWLGAPCCDVSQSETVRLTMRTNNMVTELENFKEIF